MSFYLMEFADRFEIRPASGLIVAFATRAEKVVVFHADGENGIGNVLSISWALTPGKAMEAAGLLRREYSGYRGLSGVYDACLIGFDRQLCEAHGKAQQLRDAEAQALADAQFGGGDA